MFLSIRFDLVSLPNSSVMKDFSEPDIRKKNNLQISNKITVDFLHLYNY